MEGMKITLTRGATVNLGNYESARVDLAVEGTKDTIVELDAWLKNWLAARVEEIQSEAGLPPQAPERFTGGIEERN